MKMLQKNQYSLQRTSMLRAKTLFLALVLLSCNSLPWKKEIRSIEVVKGLNLGGDYNVEKSKTFICDPRCKPFCGYELINKQSYGIIMSYPSLYYGTYEGKKILAQIKLQLLDPYNYPTIGNEITPAISDYDVSLVKDKMKEIYGYKPQSESDRTIIWNYKDDVTVRMNINKNDFSYLEDVEGVNPLVRQYRNSYSVSIEYFFTSELNDLISYEPVGTDRPL